MAGLEANLEANKVSCIFPEDSPAWWNPITGAVACARDALYSVVSGGKILASDAARIEQEAIDGMRRAGATNAQIETFKNQEYPAIVASVGGIAEDSVADRLKGGWDTLGGLLKWGVVGLIAVLGIQLIRASRT